MSDPSVRGVVVAHGGMATGLVDAVRQITGADPDALVGVSNSGLAPAALASQVLAAAGNGPAIVFTDLPAGSCGLAARLLARDREGFAVICGVNLAMLLDFVTNRNLRLPELVSHVLARGRDAIVSVPSASESHVDPVASRG